MSDVPPVPYGHDAHPRPDYTARVDIVAQRAVPAATECTPA